METAAIEHLWQAWQDEDQEEGRQEGHHRVRRADVGPALIVCNRGPERPTREQQQLHEEERGLAGVPAPPSSPLHFAKDDAGDEGEECKNVRDLDGSG